MADLRRTLQWRNGRLVCRERCLHHARTALQAGAVSMSLLGSAAVHAQPRIHVRASSRLELRVHNSARGAALEGALVDDAGLPLAGRNVELSAEASPAAPWQVVRTRADGSFAGVLSAASTRGSVLVRFAGDADHAAAQSTRHFDLAQADTQLRFLQPRDQRLDLDQETQMLVLAVASPAGAGDLEIGIADERGRTIARAKSHADGAVRIAVSSEALGEPGLGRLIARTPGDARREPAQTELQVLRLRHSSLTLRADIDPALGRLSLTGSLRSRTGALGGRTVGIFDGGRHLASVETSARGEFRYAEIAPPEAGAHARVLQPQARFDSEMSWLSSSRSPRLSVRLAPEPPTNWLWLGGPLVACALVLWLLGRGPSRAGWSVAPTPIQPGLHTRSAMDSGFAMRHEAVGCVVDHVGEQAISHAMLSLQASDGTIVELTTDSAGAFRSPALASGRWKLQVSAPGYDSLAENLSIPHRGQLHIRLVALRTAALLAYRPLAERWLPLPQGWGRWTPREALDHALRGRDANEACVRLIERVEHAAYAHAAPTQTEVSAIESEAQALAKTSMPGPAAPPLSARPPGTGLPGRR
jgi:hypothetical protein